MPTEKSSLQGDITLAAALIAAEFGVETAPDRIVAILRSFSAAHYNAGARDTMMRFARQHRAHNEPVPSSLSVTPIVGPHGRRLRQRHDSERPTPVVSPPLGAIDDDEPLGMIDDDD